MKKALIIVAILGGILVILVIVARLTGALLFYNIPTSSMEPTLVVGDKIATSSLIEPERNSIIAFKRIAGPDEGVEPGTVTVRVARLIAKGGDRVEMKGDLAFVNDKLADDTTNLMLMYRMSTADAAKLKSLLQVDETVDEDYSNMPHWMSFGNDSTTAFLDNKQYNTGRTVVHIIKSVDEYYPNNYLFMNDSSKQWTATNYGPVIVPPGCFFVLGDSRYRAQDSRYIGFIKEADFKGTIINKK
jgi:signal peptidase I